MLAEAQDEEVKHDDVQPAANGFFAAGAQVPPTAMAPTPQPTPQPAPAPVPPMQPAPAPVPPQPIPPQPNVIDVAFTPVTPAPAPAQAAAPAADPFAGPASPAPVNTQVSQPGGVAGDPFTVQGAGPAPSAGTDPFAQNNVPSAPAPTTRSRRSTKPVEAPAAQPAPANIEDALSKVFG
jgi:hypothetical protein